MSLYGHADAPPATRSRSAQLVRAARSEAVLFQIAVAVVAIHVLDDSFFQPQPGTSGRDHLVSGLMPFAVLLGLAMVYGRLSDGFRAAIALLVGLFGLVAAVEAVYYANAGRLSGDDYTGLASIPAGLLLISIAATTLWRARRTDETVLRRWLRRVLVAAAGAIGLYVVLAPFLAAYVLTHTARAFVPPARLGAPHEEVSS